MTGVLMRRGDADTDTYRGKVMGRLREKTASNQPERLQEKPTLLTLDLRLQASRTAREILLFTTPNLWYFVMTAPANK